jgi:hypothetical protein
MTHEVTATSATSRKKMKETMKEEKANQDKADAQERKIKRRTKGFTEEQQPARKLKQDESFHHPTRIGESENERVRVATERVQMLVNKAVSLNCNELTLKEAQELADSYVVLQVERGTKSKDRRYRCHFCRILHDDVSSFHKRSDLRNHYRAHLHHRIKGEMCGKSFRRQRDLQEHTKKAHEKNPLPQS